MTGLVVFNQWTPVDGCSSGAGPGGDRLAAVSRSGCGHQRECARAFVADAVAQSDAHHAHGQWARLLQRRSPPDFSVSGNAITWLSTEYSVSPGDDVVAIYYYVG